MSKLNVKNKQKTITLCFIYVLPSILSAVYIWYVVCVYVFVFNSTYQNNITVLKMNIIMFTEKS